MVAALQAIVDAFNIKLQGTSAIPTVFVARDTRKTGKVLCDHARDAALALKANVLDFGELTTPQAHHAVREFNLGGKDAPFTETGYIATYAAAFKELVGDCIKVSWVVGPTSML